MSWEGVHIILIMKVLKRISLPYLFFQTALSEGFHAIVLLHLDDLQLAAIHVGHVADQDTLIGCDEDDQPDDEVANIGDGVPVPKLSRPSKSRHRRIYLKVKFSC